MDLLDGSTALNAPASDQPPPQRLPDKKRAAKECVDILEEIAVLLNVPLDRQSLSMCISLIENGVAPEALAGVEDGDGRGAVELKGAGRGRNGREREESEEESEEEREWEREMKMEDERLRSQQRWARMHIGTQDLELQRQANSCVGYPGVRLWRLHKETRPDM